MTWSSSWRSAASSSAGSVPPARLHPTEVNHRTHRKVLIVDEAVGFTGGVGIADEWKGDARDETQWRDTHFRVRGPAVDGLRAAFLDNWCETDPVIFAEAIDRFPDQPQPGRSIVQCVRSASETGRGDVDMVFRALAPTRPGARAHHHRLLRPR